MVQKQMAMKKILVIDNRDSFVYNIVEYLRRMPEVEVQVVCDDGKTSLPCTDSFWGIVLSPGAGVPEEYVLMREVLDGRVRETMPVLGICLGMQAMVTVSGGQLRLLPVPRHGHPSRLCFCGDRPAMFASIPEGTQVGRYHSWVVDEASLPGCWNLVARDEEGNVMVVVRKDKPWTGLQFHPESIMSPQGFDMLQAWVRTLPPPEWT